jgi:hypothetical protein
MDVRTVHLTLYTEAGSTAARSAEAPILNLHLTGTKVVEVLPRTGKANTLFCTPVVRY